VWLAGQPPSGRRWRGIRHLRVASPVRVLVDGRTGAARSSGTRGGADDDEAGGHGLRGGPGAVRPGRRSAGLNRCCATAARAGRETRFAIRSARSTRADRCSADSGSSTTTPGARPGRLPAPPHGTLDPLRPWRWPRPGAVLWPASGGRGVGRGGLRPSRPVGAGAGGDLPSWVRRWPTPWVRGPTSRSPTWGHPPPHALDARRAGGIRRAHQPGSVSGKPQDAGGGIGRKEARGTGRRSCSGKP